MKRLKIILFENLWFLVPYTFLVMFSCVMLCFLDKNQIHFAINQFYTSFSDVLFKYSTQLAEGSSIVLILLISAAIRYRYLFSVALGLIYSTVIVQLLKLFLFPEIARPSVYFSNIANWHTVEGISLHQLHSFPSGHTAAAFSLYFGLAVCLKNKWFGLVFFIICFLVGYSRMYLSQHYLRDVVVGSLFGIMAVFLAQITIENSKKIGQLPWIDKSALHSLFK